MAAIGSGTWDEAVGLTAKGLESGNAVMFSPGNSARARQVVGFHGVTREVMPSYAAQWINQDPWVPPAGSKAEQFLAGATKVGTEFVSSKDLYKTDFYNGFAKPWGGDDIACLKICDVHDPVAVETHVSFFRSRDQRPFDHSSTRFLLDLWPHIRRAVQTYWRLDGARSGEVAQPNLLDRLPCAVLVLRRDGWVDYMNASALALMREHDVRGCGARKLATLPGMDAAELKQALENCHATRSSGRVAQAVKSGSAKRLRINFVPVLDDPSFSTSWPKACALVTIDSADLRDDARARIEEFSALHGLTRKEVEVLDWLLRGKSVPEIAQRMSVGYATTRTHVGSLLLKTGCVRQTELLSKVFLVR